MRRSLAAWEAQIANVEILYGRLYEAYGPQNWWPAETPFEIAVGAILVQRTAWHNAERALAALRRQNLIEPYALTQTDPAVLRELIRPAGFASAKGQYLQALAALFIDGGGIERLSSLETPQLREQLLAVRGVGPETADSILLYLFDRPVWVRDAYAQRLLERLSGTRGNKVSQDELVNGWVQTQRTQELKELHALIVEHGKVRCRAIAVCRGCPLLSLCAHGAQAVQSVG